MQEDVAPYVAPGYDIIDPATKHRVFLNNYTEASGNLSCNNGFSGIAIGQFVIHDFPWGGLANTPRIAPKYLTFSVPI